MNGPIPPKLVALMCALFILGLVVGSGTSSKPQAQTVTQTVTQTIQASTAIEANVQPSSLPSGFEVYFSPNGGCKDRLIYWISRANRTIHVLIYSFTLDDVRDALISAKNRGVDVRIVFEKEGVQQENGNEYFNLRNSGVQVRNDTNPNTMHDKIAVIDESIVITGSYNWSKGAETRNNENMIILRNSDIASRYEVEFEKIWNASR
jgi:phosphatidylserine/phosphatidylglycerophosphate/cardiolipin synthase-like enzyme